MVAAAGELLDLLAANGIDAIGIEADADVAAVARAKGHDVEVADANTFLRNSSLVARSARFFSSQFLEHIAPDAVADVVHAAACALRPGGRFIAETINPHSISALKMFWLDPSHVRPIYPETLLLSCRWRAGFAGLRGLSPWHRQLGAGSQHRR